MEDLSTLLSKEQNLSKDERLLSLISGSLLLCEALSGKKSGIEALSAGYLIFRAASGYCPVSEFVRQKLAVQD